jgi:hypothetical protein
VYRNSLELFRVDVDTGFEQVGSISKQVADEECFALLGYDPNWLNCYLEADREVILNDWRAQCTSYSFFKRGVFRADTVYAISNVDVTAHDVSDPTTTIATVALPPEYGYYQSTSSDPTVYYGMGGTSAAGGTAGAYYETAGAAGAYYGVYNPYGCGGAGGAGGDGSMMGMAGGTSAGGTSAGGAGGSMASP